MDKSHQTFRTFNGKTIEIDDETFIDNDCVSILNRGFVVKFNYNTGKKGYLVLPLDTQTIFYNQKLKDYLTTISSYGLVLL